jgi:hypothetical protein
VSGEYFSSLGVAPYRGRLIQPADESAACPATVGVVSYEFWRQRMGSPELPATLRVNLEPVEVVGVSGFRCGGRRSVDVAWFVQADDRRG